VGVLNKSKIKSINLPDFLDALFLKTRKIYLYMKNIITSNTIKEAVAIII
jgi:hypothetical protein